MADRQLLALIAYVYKSDRGTALDLYAKVRRRAVQLAKFSHSGRLGRMAGTRELVVARTSYVIVYAVDPDAVTIVQVLHAAQQYPPEDNGM